MAPIDKDTLRKNNAKATKKAIVKLTPGKAKKTLYPTDTEVFHDLVSRLFDVTQRFEDVAERLEKATRYKSEGSTELEPWQQGMLENLRGFPGFKGLATPQTSVLVSVTVADEAILALIRAHETCYTWRRLSPDVQEVSRANTPGTGLAFTKITPEEADSDCDDYIRVQWIKDEQIDE